MLSTSSRKRSWGIRVQTGRMRWSSSSRMMRRRRARARSVMLDGMPCRGCRVALPAANDRCSLLWTHCGLPCNGRGRQFGIGPGRSVLALRALNHEHEECDALDLGGRSSNLEDRRGLGGRAGMGIGGAVVLLVLSLIFGRDFIGESGAQPRVTSTSNGGLSPADSAREEPEVVFVSQVLDDVQHTWARILPKYGTPYHDAKLVLFRDATGRRPDPQEGGAERERRHLHPRLRSAAPELVQAGIRRRRSKTV